MKKIIICMLIVTMFLISTIVVKGNKENSDYQQGVLLLKVENPKIFEDYKSYITSYDEDCIAPFWYKVTLNQNVSTVSAYKYFLNEKNILEVDYNRITKISSTNNDTKYNTIGKNEGYDYINKMGYNPGADSSIVVAVIDTGIDYTHLKFKDRFWKNEKEIEKNGIDDDNNGYVDDIIGYDFVNNDNDPMDDFGHGTHVAGIIAGNNDSDGFAGLAYNAKLMILKAADNEGEISLDNEIKALLYARDNGADIINMSFGSYSTSKIELDVINEVAKSCILVAAAGNDGLPTSGFIGATSYPAAYKNVIGVMSVNSNGTKVSSFSNYDTKPFSEALYDVYAPGEGVIAPYPSGKYVGKDGRYESLSGTSMSTPFVSAIAAILKSIYQDASNADIISMIKNIKSNSDYDLNRPVVNLYDSLIMNDDAFITIKSSYVFDPLTISKNNNINYMAESGETIHLSFDYINYGSPAYNLEVELVNKENDSNIKMKSKKYSYTKLENFCSINHNKTIDKIDKVNNYYVDANQAFEIEINNNIPNNYVVHLELIIKYNLRNGESKETIIPYDLKINNKKDVTLDAEYNYVEQGRLMMVTFKFDSPISYLQTQFDVNFDSQILTLKYYVLNNKTNTYNINLDDLADGKISFSLMNDKITDNNLIILTLFFTTNSCVLPKEAIISFTNVKLFSIENIKLKMPKNLVIALPDSALLHDNHQEEVKATCVSTGEISAVCKVCKRKNTYKLTPKGIHNDLAVDYEWNNNHNSCVGKINCSIDGNVYEEEVTATKEILIKPTCLKEGKIVYTATFKNDFLKKQSYEETLPKEVHNNNKSSYEWNKNHTECIGRIICQIDNEIIMIKNAEIEKIVINPTCTETGKISYYAHFNSDNIADVYYEEILPNLNHNYQNKVYEWNDEENIVTAKEICLNDSSHIITETATINKTILKEATCKDKGIIKLSVTFVNKDFEPQTKEIEVSKLKHLGSDWIIDLLPTKTKEGKKHKECINCGEVLEEKILEKIKNNKSDCKTQNVIKALSFLTLSILLIKLRKKE